MDPLPGLHIYKSRPNWDEQGRCVRPLSTHYNPSVPTNTAQPSMSEQREVTREFDTRQKDVTENVVLGGRPTELKFNQEIRLSKTADLVGVSTWMRDPKGFARCPAAQLKVLLGDLQGLHAAFRCLNWRSPSAKPTSISFQGLRPLLTNLGHASDGTLGRVRSRSCSRSKSVPTSSARKHAKS
jgi:hypothetical protein